MRSESVIITSTCDNVRHVEGGNEKGEARGESYNGVLGAHCDSTLSGRDERDTDDRPMTMGNLGLRLSINMYKTNPKRYTTPLQSPSHSLKSPLESSSSCL